jgi:hypothetical protein
MAASQKDDTHTSQGAFRGPSIGVLTAGDEEMIADVSGDVGLGIGLRISRRVGAVLLSRL